MSWMRNLVNKELLLIVAGFGVVFSYLLHWHVHEREALTQRFIDDQLVVVDEKREGVETALTSVYENLRTVTLLPSVKAIPGGNRQGEEEDIIASGRFSVDAMATVQQIYNNLAARVNVSEVYAVIDGLDASKGETPFFMIDTLVFGDGVSDEAEAPKPADFPEEAEEEEYAYFPRQTAAIRAAHPRFDFEAIDDIPAFASPLMRTCDNSQYRSESRDNVKDSYGILYSVPFYDQGGAFRGVISAIVRGNVFEALLMGVPFVPITQQDLAEQRKADWQLPAPARFVLSNEHYGIEIFDRRHTDLHDLIAQGVEGRNVFRVRVEVPSDAPWELTYYLPDAMITEALAEHDLTFLILVTVVVASLIAAAVASTLLNRIRTRLGGGTEQVSKVVQAVSSGDLNLDIGSGYPPSSVLGSMQAMVDDLSGHMRAIEFESKQIAQSSYQIRDISKEIVEVSEHEKQHSEVVAEAMSALASTMQLVQEISNNVRTRADEAHETAKVGTTAVQNNIAELQTVLADVVVAEEKIGKLDLANKQIQAIVKTISEITGKTSMLALNAAIEAARAGESGRGFAVVADEVRKLATHAAAATNEISGIIEDLNNLVAENIHAMQRVGERTRASVERAQDSSIAIDNIGRVIDANTSAAHQISVVSEEQKEKVQALHNSIGELIEVLQKNALKVHTTGAISNDLYQVTERLRKLLHHFHFDKSQISMAELNEHRHVPRYPNHLLVHVDDHGVQREALTADMSLTGIRLRVPIPLQYREGDLMTMRIMTPLDDQHQRVCGKPIAIEGRIVWRRTVDLEGIYYGVEFLSIGADQRGCLEACFEYFNQHPVYDGGGGN